MGDGLIRADTLLLAMQPATQLLAAAKDIRLMLVVRWDVEACALVSELRLQRGTWSGSRWTWDEGEDFTHAGPQAAAERMNELLAEDMVSLRLAPVFQGSPGSVLKLLFGQYDAVDSGALTQQELNDVRQLLKEAPWDDQLRAALWRAALEGHIRPELLALARRPRRVTPEEFADLRATSYERALVLLNASPAALRDTLAYYLSQCGTGARNMPSCYDEAVVRELAPVLVARILADG